MTKIFVTGGTGYLGGDAIHAILDAHPDFEISCLVRNQEAIASLVKVFPSVRIVHGDLESSELLELEAASSDIVCNFANAAHVQSAQSLARGLSLRKQPGPGFLIHVTGAGPLVFEDVMKNRFDKGPERTLNDTDGLPDVLSAPNSANARETESAVRNAGVEFGPRVKTAIVCTGSVYGLGRGTIQYRGGPVQALVRSTLQRGHGIVVGEGRSTWPHVHVKDLSDLFLRLVENAAAGGVEDGEGPAVWGGREGYYFAENGEHAWHELAQVIATEIGSRGIMVPGEVVSIEPAEAAKLFFMGQLFWGCSCRVEGRRARQALGWQPCGPPLREEMKHIVDEEAKKLGLK